MLCFEHLFQKLALKGIKQSNARHLCNIAKKRPLLEVLEGTEQQSKRYMAAKRLDEQPF
jgi:hypothetical protein